MNRDLKQVLISALNGVPATANFSAEETDRAAINAMLKEIGIDENSTSREIRAKEDLAFALIEEAVDEILPKKLENLLGEFAEVKQFARDAEVVFNIEKIGKNRAKLTISKGARGGIYRAAKLDSKYFSLNTEVYTVAVYVTLEEIILGTMSLAELYSNILEGFQEIVYKEVFNELAQGTAVAGYGRIGESTEQPQISASKSSLAGAIDEVMPYVKQYGIPTIFGSYSALEGLYNPVASTEHPNMLDSADIRNTGLVQVYKGAKVVELPNYLIGAGNDNWFYDEKYVFVMPSGAKPVKVALKGDLTLVRNTQATGSEKWEAHKLMGVGLAMANNYAVINITTESDSTVEE